MARYRIIQARTNGKFYVERYTQTKRGTWFWNCVGNMKMHDTFDDAQHEVEVEMKRDADYASPIVVKEFGG